MDALAHQELPFQKLVEAVDPARDASYAPIFQTAMRLLHENDDYVALAGTEQIFEDMPAGGSVYDLSLIVGIDDMRSHGRLEFNRALFDRSTAETMAERFLGILQAVAADPNIHLSDLPIMDAEEQQRVLSAWNATDRVFPDDQCVHELFEEQAARSPDSIAVEYDGRSLSYSQLNQHANRVARRLREIGIGPDMPVAVYADRSPEIITAFLGILKAGGAYLPLDPTDPAERLQQIVDDARPRAVLTQRQFGNQLTGHLPNISPLIIEDLTLARSPHRMTICHRPPHPITWRTSSIRRDQREGPKVCVYRTRR